MSEGGGRAEGSEEGVAENGDVMLTSASNPYPINLPSTLTHTLLATFGNPVAVAPNITHLLALYMMCTQKWRSMK